jgi:xylose isomerase
MGLWGLQNVGADPFGGPVRSVTVMEALDALAASGIRLVSVHDNDLWPYNARQTDVELTIQTVLGMLEERGMKLYNFTTNSFSHPAFRSGALASPVPQVRAAAIAKITQAMDYADAMGAENFIFWGGREGTDGAYETARGFQMYMDGLRQCVTYAIERGYTYNFSLEPKVYEPRLMGLYVGTGASAAAAILGWFNEAPYKGRVGVNPEYPQHLGMLCLDPAMELDQLLTQGMLADFIHFGGQIPGRMDCDLAAGLGGNIYADFMVCLTLHQRNWQGKVEFDCRPVRTTTGLGGLKDFACWNETYWRMLESRVLYYVNDPVSQSLEYQLGQESPAQHEIAAAMAEGKSIVPLVQAMQMSVDFDKASEISTDLIEELWRRRLKAAFGTPLE